MTTPKKSSFSSSCRGKELSKMTDVSKLLKKVEKISKRIFHGERTQSTFVPSAQQQQQNSGQSTSSSDSQMPHQPVMINPPYPVHPGFGTGFPQFPYPQQQQSQQPHYPPVYGWALNSEAAAAAASANSSNSQAPVPPTTGFGALSLDVGVGNETAGSGFDHLTGHHHHEDEQLNDLHSYLRPDLHEITELRKAQSAKLEVVKQRVMNEVAELSLVSNDAAELTKWFDAKYPYTLIKEDTPTTEQLEEQVKMLEEKLRRLRAKSPGATAPPPRPPPPRSVSQESSLAGPWQCDRCSTENPNNEYRCKQCSLPSRRFDPIEIESCGCEYCTSTVNST